MAVQLTDRLVRELPAPASGNRNHLRHGGKGLRHSSDGSRRPKLGTEL